MSDCRKCADLEWCNEHEECGLFKPRKMTNADRIRIMTNEELAHLFHSVEEHLFTGNLWNYEKWTDWLNRRLSENEMGTV